VRVALPFERMFMKRQRRAVTSPPVKSALHAIRARVERLAANVHLACDGNHSPVKISMVEGGTLAPDWPEPGMPTHCACGVELSYSHIIHELWPQRG
jgi:hypothetical protein